MDVSIIIVNYKTAKLTIQSIESIYESIHRSFEIIVIDNNSNDQLLEWVANEYPEVITIQNHSNLGFAKANNQGLRIAQGRYLLLLNSDTVIQPDTLVTMIEFMDNHPTVGAAGCKVVLPDGSLDKACRRGFPTPEASFYYAFGFSKLFPKVKRFNQYQLGYLDENEKYPIDCLVGAFMMVRRETMDSAGMLDENFFMYGEDIDWCYRIKKLGWEIYYYPSTQITHYKGASSRSKPVKIIYEFHRAMWVFHRKHYKTLYPWVINLFIFMGISVKFLISLLVNMAKKAVGSK